MRSGGPSNFLFLAGAGFLASACTFSALEISLPALGDGGATAVALEVGSKGRLDRVQFVSLFDRSELESRGVLPFDPEFGLDADARVSLIEYTGGLGMADLGYPSGELEHAPDPLPDDPLKRRISLSEFPAVTRELRVSEGEVGTWRPREGVELDGPLRDFRFRDLQPACACLTGRILETKSSTSGTVFLAHFGPRRTMVGTEDGHLYWVRPELPDSDALVDVTPLSLLPFAVGEGKRGISVGGGIALDEDHLLVTDYRGWFWIYELDDNDEVARVTKVAEWSRAGLADNRHRVRWMTYVPPFIYGLDLEAEFSSVNLETGEATRIHTFEYQPSYQHGGVAYSRKREEVVVASVHSNRLGRYRRGEFKLDPPVNAAESLSAAHFLESFGGWLLGTPLSGKVHHEVDTGIWETCPSQLGNSIGAIVPFRDGFLLGSTQGFIEQYSAADGWCEKLQPASNSIRFMVPFDPDAGSFVVTGPNLEERPQLYPTVTLLETNKQSECNGIRNPGGDAPATCRFALPE